MKVKGKAISAASRRDVSAIVISHIAPPISGGADNEERPAIGARRPGRSEKYAPILNKLEIIKAAVIMAALRDSSKYVGAPIATRKLFLSPRAPEESQRNRSSRNFSPIRKL